MAGYTKNADGTYSVNYDDDRFINVKNEQAQKEEQTNQSYNEMINNSDNFYNQQIDAAQNYADKQTELQQAQTDFNIQQINQQKDQTEKDYIKEQKASYTDYQKESNKYGVNAEQLATSGLSNTGYSETSRVSMYNTYQNRVASARDTYNRAVLDFDNQIQQAILNNNDKIAEIAYNALQNKLQLSQQSFEYKNQLVLAKEEALQRLNDEYYARYQDVLEQITNEIDLQVQIDKINREYEQWAQEFDLKYQSFIESKNQWAKEFDLKMKEYDLQQRQVDAQIANIRASTAYTQAQSKAINNPYSDTTSSNNLSKKAQEIYDKTLETAKSMTTSEGKQRARNSIATKLSQLLNAKVITDSEMQIIASKAYSILGSSSGGGR